MLFTIKYYAGPYSGKRTVDADDEEEAIAIVKAAIRKDMTIAMYADGYKIVDGKEEDTNNENE